MSKYKTDSASTACELWVDVWKRLFREIRRSRGN